MVSSNDINPYAAIQIDKLKAKSECIKPLVVIRCMTYNHAAYICNALDGFVMQKTTFPFIAIIHDDASTDGTSDILKEYSERYPDIIFPIFEKDNQYSKKDGSLRRIMTYATKVTGASYVALCEGDDFWTDPHKLQKQVSIMEKNPSITLTFHRIAKLNEKNCNRSGLGKVVENRKYDGIEWFQDRPSQTSSFVYRYTILTSELYNKVTNNPKFIVGDIPLVMTCAKLGSLYGLEDTMSTYRQHSGGWTAVKRNDEQRWKTIQMQLEYRIFGKEFEESSRYYAQKDAISYFLSDLKNGKLNLKFLKYSLSLSVSGTLKAFYKVIRHKNN